ncbi:MAG: hypothetical protein MR675_12420 [Lachnospira sp.]|nr:hypothetical protein [Lachnospira sp.]
MGNIQYCYILEAYYKDHPGLKQILDVNDSSKHNIRTHLCLNVEYNGQHVLIPLRKSMGEANRKFGKIGFSVPSQLKPDAGLDYRYIMIIEEEKYIRYDAPRIPTSQQKIIADNYDTIEREALEYIKSYSKVAKKSRVDKTARFRASSLINFDKELKISQTEDTVEQIDTKNEIIEEVAATSEVIEEAESSKSEE